MGTREKILVVDDDFIVTTTLKNVLEMEGFSCVEYFNDPLEALEYVKNNNDIDVVISDFMMPQMNGIEFLGFVKKYVAEASTILLTGYSDKESAIKAINEIGLYKYIEKPWDNDSLVMNIKNALERSNLLKKLNQKIDELEISNKKIEEYSISLEKIVEEKTQNLKKTNNMLSAIFSNCADGILTISAKGEIVQANQAFENMVGMSQEMLQSKNVNELFLSDKNPFMTAFLQDVKEVLLRDFDIVNCLNKKTIPVEINIAPIIGEEKQDLFVAVVRNVKLQKDLERLRDDFVATLTHDLRTPLLASIQALEFFIDGTLGAINNKQEKILSTMKKSSEDILGLVNTLLEVYKYESGKIALCPYNFNLNELLEYVHQELSPLALKKGIEFSTDINDTKDLMINADKNELRRVLINLAANAINHNQQGVSIEIITKIQQNDLLVTVKDNGTGIAKKDIPRIFKRFSQCANKGKSLSTGLGLYLSRQIIEAHNGKIWVESDLGKGCEFSFLLSGIVKDKVNV